MGLGLVLGHATPADATAPSDWFNVKVDYGATGNGSTDDTTAIQNAINAAAASGVGTVKGGVVWFPPGQYVASTLSLRTGVTLAGVGTASQLLLKSGVDAPLLSVWKNVDGTQAAYVTVRDLCLLGSTATHTANRHGIQVSTNHASVSTPLTGGDSYLDLSNVIVAYFGGHGVALGLDPSGGTADVREVRLINVVAFSCGKAATANDISGIYVRSTDSAFIGCTSAGNNGAGFEIVRANNRFANCKGFYNYVEFLITADRNQLSNCQAQDGHTDGYRLASVMHTSMADCSADSNANIGVNLTSVTYSSLSGLMAFVRAGKTSTGPGVQFTTTSHCFVAGAVNGFPTNVSGTNTSGITNLAT